MYDRSALVRAARAKGDARSADLSRRLGIPRNTAWRLWTGKTAPTIRLAAAVERHYGVKSADLTRRTAA